MPTNKKPTKKANSKTSSINVYTSNYIKLVHSEEALIGEFFLQCNHRDTDDTRFSTLGAANKAAEDHIKDNPGHVVRVKVRQNSNNV